MTYRYFCPAKRGCIPAIKVSSNLFTKRPISRKIFIFYRFITWSPLTKINLVSHFILRILCEVLPASSSLPLLCVEESQALPQQTVHLARLREHGRSVCLRTVGGPRQEPVYHL